LSGTGEGPKVHKKGGRDELEYMSMGPSEFLVTPLLTRVVCLLSQGRFEEPVRACLSHILSSSSRRVLLCPFVLSLLPGSFSVSPATESRAAGEVNKDSRLKANDQDKDKHPREQLQCLPVVTVIRS